ncbi:MULTISPECIES: alpha/beta fold hydrolase [Dyella]|uniref:Alpha/beta hydrolase n=2 Tax=Dyella TaxID=231454 RepID=A0A4R0YHC1_9GAMM|nr:MULTISPECIES: alpha/beta hydrolase [Dyella]TBR37100.1 alpha/beta hydrolase [Dyella terrae]TCI07810.1 alpha/beta hydrolase [Dyella soli]
MFRRQFLGLAAGTVAGGLFASFARPALALASASAAQPYDALAHHAARRYVRTPQGNIAYVERGQGPAALFLHGFPLNSFQWRDALARLSPYRRCIAPDWLGLGYTQVAAGQPVTPAAQVDMLAALLDRLDVQTVDVVANDSGGAVAQMFATRFPQRVRTLLLTNCDVEEDCPPPAVLPVIELARKGRYAEEWLVPWVADKDLARSDKGLGGLTFTFPDKLADETIDMYLAPLVASPARKQLTDAYAMGLAPNPMTGVDAKLRSLQVPTRILWGTGDDIFAADSPKHLDRVLPKSRGVRYIHGAKLFFPEEFPDIIAEEARRLWGV